jgi:hypothetical protein
MGSKVKALVDAGPFQQTPYYSSDQAARQVQNLAGRLHETIMASGSGGCSAAPVPSPTLVVMKDAVAAAPSLPVDQASALDLFKQLVRVVVPLSWDDFLANLIMFIIILSVAALLYLVCSCTTSRLRGGKKVKASSYRAGALLLDQRDALGVLLD